MLDTICSLPLSSDLFALALHPTEPVLTVGLSSGHVHTYRLPSDADDSDPPLSPPQPTTNGTSNGNHESRKSSIISSYRRSSSASENGLGSISTLWSTRRHRGSCRAVSYDLDGTTCFSAGTDSLIKQFDTLTGKVLAKYPIYLDEGNPDPPTVLQVVGNSSILIATDSGKLELRDTRLNNTTANGTTAPSNSLSGSWHPHNHEHVNDLLLLPASDTSTSGVPKSCISVGGTTLAVTDFRKGVIHTSEDQDVELTSVALVSGLKKGGTSVGEKVLVGQADGVISLFERGVWDDLDERIVIDKTGGGVDRLVEVPASTEMASGKVKANEKIVAAGLEDGRIRFVRIGRNGVLNDWDIKHDDMEGVSGLGFDVTGRLVSGGGQIIKVWTQATGEPGGGKDMRKRSFSAANMNGYDESESGDDESEDGDEEQRFEDDESSDDEAPKSKRKKRKRNKGKDKSGGTALNFSGIL